MERSRRSVPLLAERLVELCNMKSRIALSIIVAVALCAAFSLGYRSGYTHASKRAVIFERDTADTPGQGSAKAVYEPCSAKANPIPTEVR